MQRRTIVLGGVPGQADAVLALWQEHAGPVGLGGVPSRLEGGGIVGDPVALGPELPDIQCDAGLEIKSSKPPRRTRYAALASEAFSVFGVRLV